MSLPLAEASAGDRVASRLRYAWLFSRRADLAMLLLPVLATAIAFSMALRFGQAAGERAHGYAGWIAAYLFGNTSHVLLTFLLLGARRDVLHATPRQAVTVIPGSLLVFGVSLTLMRLTANDPWTRPFFEIVTAVFATHHTLSQAKGFWALYNLRAAKAGAGDPGAPGPAGGALPPPSERERELQKLFVPLGLLFIAVKWTLVAKIDMTGVGPFMNVNPGEPAVLPFSVTYGLLAAWLVYTAVLFRALLAYDTLNAAKLLYLGTQCSVIALELLSPGWGVTIAAGIHGLEYYFLTRKMLAPTPAERGATGEARARLVAALCWPAMIAAMSPILVVGALQGPWLSLGDAAARYKGWALMLVNATVLAHYCADAFLYRFRIPGIRKVALARLGLER